MSKEGLALFTNILDKKWYARNHAIFKGKCLLVLGVIADAQQSYNQYKDSKFNNKIQNRNDKENHKDKNKDNVKEKKDKKKWM